MNPLKKMGQSGVSIDYRPLWKIETGLVTQKIVQIACELDLQNTGNQCWGLIWDLFPIQYFIQKE